MDKKNTLLLTVIAVATLLVAVVGATFAYFSLSATGTATTTATVKTGKISTITLANTENSLYLGVTTAEMAKEVSASNNVNYWATTNPFGGDTVESNNTTGESTTPTAIATLTLSNDGDSGVEYKCTTKFTINAGTLSQIEGLKATDGELVLSTSTTGTGTTKIGTSAVDTGAESKTYTLDQLKNNQEFWLITDLTTGNDAAVGTLSATFKIVNRKDVDANDGDQSYLAGQDITLTIKSAEESDAAGKLTCNIVQPD